MSIHFLNIFYVVLLGAIKTARYTAFAGLLTFFEQRIKLKTKAQSLCLVDLVLMVSLF